VCLVPLTVQLAMFNGVDPRTNEAVGPATGMLYDHADFESFYQAFLKQFACHIHKTVEAYNILLVTQRDEFPDVIRSAWMDGGMEVARDYLSRTVPFENGVSINMVGMANAADALAAVKRLVFDTHEVDAETLLRAIVEDWETFGAIQHLCETAPKYGNNDAFVDEIAARLWADVARLTSECRTIYGAPAIPTGISVSSNIHGGRNTAATADGRFSGDSFADGSISPEQGKDTNGPLSMLESAMRIPQNSFAATLMNMKFSPTSLASDEDLGKLADMIRIYFANGGRQIQFNVVNKKTLIAAKKQRNKYRDLIVRVAGYSAYYTALSENIQDEIIKRSEQVM
jgi:formate C-acetyltransferase